MLGGRSRSMVVKEAFRWRNYLALARMARVYPAFREGAGRYFLGRGSYPCDWLVRTPAGTIAPRLYGPHDMYTVNELFCRGDYAASGHVGVVVDVGSNIGISALYFLTRDPASRLWLYEPVPENVERLRHNLRGYEDRCTIAEAAVAAEPGQAQFGVEDTGRYGGIGVVTGRSIAVECLGIREVLEEALAHGPVVDVLKIDTEGTELDILRAIPPELLARVRTVYAETGPRTDLEFAGFRTAFRNDTLILSSCSL